MRFEDIFFLSVDKQKIFAFNFFILTNPVLFGSKAQHGLIGILIGELINNGRQRTAAVAKNIKTDQRRSVLHRDGDSLIFLGIKDEVLHKRGTVKHQ
mgnify:CR=1 FL=1